MPKSDLSKQADSILKDLSADLKKDPSGGASMFIDLLTVERFKAKAVLESSLRYSLLLNVIFLALVFYLAFPKVDVKVAQQRIDGTLAEIAITDKPYYDLDDIKIFAQKRAVTVHSWVYDNYLQTFEDERVYWDAEPLDMYVNSLLAQNVFSSAKQYRRRFTAVVPYPVSVVQQVKYDREYRMYRIKLILHDESVDIEGVDTKKWEINMDVREVTPEEGWAGLKVARYDEVVKL